MTTTRTTRIPNRFADGGACQQEGNLPLYMCNTCKREVVWATSSRTGRKYLAPAFRYQSDSPYESWYYVKRTFHKCEPVVDEVAEVVEPVKPLSEDELQNEIRYCLRAADPMRRLETMVSYTTPEDIERIREAISN